MRTIIDLGKLSLAAVAAAVACGGSGAAANLAGSWPAVSLTVTTNCNGTTQTSNTTTSYNLGAGTDSDLQGTSSNGCLFKWTVSGNTANLSNAPVTCSTTANGAAVVITYNTYSLTSGDGHNLAVTATGTLTSGANSCSYSITGSGTR